MFVNQGAKGFFILNLTAGPTPPPPEDEFLLLETGDFLLLENGDKLILG